MSMRSVLYFLLSSFPLYFVAVDCGVPVISNAVVTTSLGTLYPNPGVFACIPGYQYTGSGSLVIRCWDDGNWTTPGGVCAGKIMKVYICACTAIPAVMSIQVLFCLSYEADLDRVGDTFVNA